MIAILGKGLISCLISSNNRNPQKIYTLLGFYETCDREAATTRGCHLGYADTLKTATSFILL